jgi:hypothetical protein
MERYTRYRLEKAVQDANDNNIAYLKEEFQTLLESNRPYQAKADYIGYSVSSIDEKIKMLDQEVKSLKLYKQRLKYAKDLALEVGAEVFDEFGISKIEGNGISSVTISSGTKASKLAIKVLDEATLIEQGYYKKVLDEKKITAHYMDGEYKEFLETCCEFNFIDNVTLPKLRINKRRAVNNTDNPSTKIDDVA